MMLGNAKMKAALNGKRGLMRPRAVWPRPALYANLRIMSTSGAASAHASRGSCHFDLAT
jgi:hypothetical protein